MSSMSSWTLEHLLKMDPIDLEDLVAYLFNRMGYSAHRTQQSRDGGVDVELMLEHFGISHRWLVQVKRYSDAVGVKEVREYGSLRYRDNVDGVIIVTTATFTKEACNEAAIHNVKLIEGPLLVSMLRHYCLDTGPRQTTGSVENTLQKEDNSAACTILRHNEAILARESVVLEGEKVTMVLTNRHIDFERSGGMLSRKIEIVRRIDVKDIIGIHEGSRDVFIVVGPRVITVLRIRPRNCGEIRQMFDRIRSDYMRGESLLRFTRTGSHIIILTSRRLVLLNVQDESIKEIRLKDIVGSEVVGSGLFNKRRLVVMESKDGIVRHQIDVDDAQIWNNALKEGVRTA
ncbi:MAG: restriction endonuclease [Methanosarcinaceae archaeon]|nr:restriction endonuclease [Methanosarcinaceae archaeon]